MIRLIVLTVIVIVCIVSLFSCFYLVLSPSVIKDDDDTLSTVYRLPDLNKMLNVKYKM